VDYFDEHVEADAVHEQVALREVCGQLLEADPALAWTVAFGAATCLCLDDLTGSHLVERWRHGRSTLRRPAAVPAALAGGGA
jgi:hypothetical protein